MRTWVATSLLLGPVLLFATLALMTTKPPGHSPKPDLPRPDATWPWRNTTEQNLGHGISRVRSTSNDGTELELYTFDFRREPRLRFELYDQDEDDAVPFDNLADYYPHSVAHVTADLNWAGRGKVLVAWNGPFFGYDRKPGMGPNGMARHVAPVVIRGKVWCNVSRIRWSFGVKNTPDGPDFRVDHAPTREQLAERYDFAAGALQCLIFEGKPLRKGPYPDPAKFSGPIPSTPDEVGAIRWVDTMPTSRTSLGWTPGDGKLHLLIVNEPDHELGSKLAAKYATDESGGWSLTDLQAFWVAFGAQFAVNSDGGAVTQSVTRLPNGDYEMLPPRLTWPNQRLVLGPDLFGAPEGGTLLTFFVRLSAD